MTAIEVDRTAGLSPDGVYRWWLGRDFIPTLDGPPLGGHVVFVMLNPSTADHTVDDPTIRRCIRFAHDWGFAGLRVVNLYAYRATNPRDLWNTPDPVGADNDQVIWDITMGRNVVAAWGTNAKPDRVERAKLLLSECALWCLGKNADGSPKHPLYVRSDKELEQWP